MSVHDLRAQSYDIIFYNTNGCDEIFAASVMVADMP